MDLKVFTSAIMEIAENKGMSQEKVIEIISEAIAAAYKKDYGKKKQKIVAELNPKTGEVSFWQLKLVVDKTMIFSEEELKKLKEKEVALETLEEKEGGKGKIRFNPERHIMFEEAKKINKSIKPEEELKIPLKTEKEYGRIAAQTAKQVILQKIKEAEREEILKEYKSKEGEIVSGIVQRIEPTAIFLDIGKTSGILLKAEQVPNEFYRPGQRLKLYLLKVEETPKGPMVFLSRAYPKLISKLFELEVPEISAGQVVIKSIAREAGSRSKIAVTATEEGIDPIGSMVGQRGTRILAVINELGGEKIDVIEWDEESTKYLANALSPAKVLEVKVLEKNKAEALVPPDQISLAIGKNGQNVRLAAKLTGWRIDVKPAEQTTQQTEAEK
ncbi:transcription termination/antitermination protein NusA [bacterium (Candidatus Gribaldobacteria) CG07_land_8_20_14_0_80_33_18]|uniref:Transcription termination/antitermination protein NusA n=1 Tax=bacterium (Candidatus Gribaldobacteria) CG07_land_8_20_14_0_80_33_18 TaxID=2014272 RepID=A0A2M6Z3U0_9BACT|nr:MAG: transcription termination/antitermination protein NusA [bacterium (Candidatus Gribaldobacteria) CG07_land_8_20_14_0_80_33_18]PJA01308.1 MAG: transcription termination/antitermination protein NusA [bacterium (Candidatus Gribaldobacteria) CG_4_10_14_0_2_um_filter_33_15]PJB08357.1 MAG: transcription termination/antitermination protein NusA [bacterium (Candidatus Gribaldobacteria) CG_4_9_14_3_um_filter_33_9]